MWHYVAYEWGYLAFPPATIEALELLSNSHMFNSLQYAAAQVTSYMVVVARHLHKVSSYFGELSYVRAEQDDLRAKLLEMEKEKRTFEERYELMAGKKASLEEHVATLDGQWSISLSGSRLWWRRPNHWRLKWRQGGSS